MGLAEQGVVATEARQSAISRGFQQGVGGVVDIVDVQTGRTHEGAPGVGAVQGEAVVQLIQDEVVAGVRFPSQTSHVGLAAVVTRHVTHLQTGAQQVLTSEAGVEVQAHAVREGGVVCFVAVVITNNIRQASSHGHHHFTGQLGGGGELVSFQLGGAGFESIHATAQGSQFSREFFLQLLQLAQIFLGGQGIGSSLDQVVDPIEASVQTGGKLVAAQGAVALEGAIRITGDATIALNQRLQRLESPVSGLHVGQLRHGGHLVHAGEIVLQAKLDRRRASVNIGLGRCFTGKSALSEQQREASSSRAQAQCIPEQFHSRFLTPIPVKVLLSQYTSCGDYRSNRQEAEPSLGKDSRKLRLRRV